MAKKKSYLVDESLKAAAGLPPKYQDPLTSPMKNEVRKQLRILDEQNAVNRYKWINLPRGLDSQLLERVLYYKGQGMFFYMKELEQFFFLPYALDGSIDVYGRFLGVTPLPFRGGTTTASNGEKEKPWITGLTKKPVYEVVFPEDLKLEDLYDKCVLLHDYTPQSSEIIISRQQLQDPLLDIMANCIPYMNTALQNSTGTMGMRVSGEDEAQNVEAANASIQGAALNGRKFVSIVGSIEFQELGAGTAGAGNTEQYMLAMQSLDNYRLSLYGLDNGGLFQKKSHMLEAEQEMNQSNVGLVMEDGLIRRQNFCDIVNSIWGLGIECIISETVIGMDMNGDMVVGGESDENQLAQAQGITEVEQNV